MPLKINFRWAEAKAPEVQEEKQVASFKRSFLESMGLTEVQINAIMDEHVGVTDELKAQRDKYKADAEKLPEVLKQLDAFKGGEDYKAKYEKEHGDFEAYKQKIAQDAETEKVKAAYRKLLTEEKISEKRLDAVIRLTDFTKMKLDKDGNLVDADKLRSDIKSEWSDYIQTETVKGAKVETPPYNGNGKMTKDQILAINDTAARQKAIAENLDLFQKG